MNVLMQSHGDRPYINGLQTENKIVLKTLCSEPVTRSLIKNLIG